MVSFRLHLAESFVKDIRQLPKTVILKALKQLIELQQNPTPPQSKKLVGKDKLYRVRLGDYRLIYELDEDNQTIHIFYLRHRRDVYRQL